MTTCASCGEDEAKRRFIVQGPRADARICDVCLCMYVAHDAHERGLPPPAGLAKLGVQRPYAEWPLERSLRRFNFVYGRARARLAARLRGALRKAKPASPLAGYFVRPPVSPLARFERRCAFCGARDVWLYGRAARMCPSCVEHAARTLLG
jgi:hypothetical protein